MHVWYFSHFLLCVTPLLVLHWSIVETRKTKDSRKCVQSVQRSLCSAACTHPEFVARLFPVLQALVPAAGMPETDQAVKN